MPSYPLLAVYCLLVIAASLGGGLIPMLVKLTHRRLQFATSVIGGFMLGVALLHLMPHALQAAAPAAVAQWMLLGMLLMYLLERFFNFHHHEVAEVETDTEAGHDDHCDHHDHVHLHEHRLSWSGAAVGLAIHSVIAGIALAAAMSSEHESRWAGLAVFLVIVSHKPLDAMTLLTLMTAHGWSKRARHLANFIFSLAVPMGAGLFIFGLAGGDLEHSQAVAAVVAFAAGVFLCVALSDLLPELQFHAHDKFKLTAALLLGVALAWAITFLESGGHAHAH